MNGAALSVPGASRPASQYNHDSDLLNHPMSKPSITSYQPSFQRRHPLIVCSIWYVDTKCVLIEARRQRQVQLATRLKSFLSFQSIATRRLGFRPVDITPARDILDAYEFRLTIH